MPSPTFFSELDTKSQLYLEHIYAQTSALPRLVAVVYETLASRYKFYSLYRASSSESYTAVADAKHDLFVHLEYAIRKYGFQ